MGLVFGNFLDEILVDFIFFFVFSIIIGKYIFDKYYMEP